MRALWTAPLYISLCSNEVRSRRRDRPGGPEGGYGGETENLGRAVDLWKTRAELANLRVMLVSSNGSNGVTPKDYGAADRHSLGHRDRP